MPAVYEISDRSASLTAAARYAEIRTGTQRAYIREVGVTVGVAGASPTVGLIRPNAIGVTPTTPKTALPIDPQNPVAATITTATAWGTAPTLAASPVYLRRVTLPATLGAGWVWSWPQGEELVIANASSLLIDLVAISAATATAIDFYVKYVE